MKSSRDRLNRVIEGLDTGEFELVGFEASIDAETSHAHVKLKLRRTPKSFRGDGLPGKPRPKRRDFAKQTRELIFDDEKEFI